MNILIYARDLQDTPPNIGASYYYAEKLKIGLFLRVNTGSTHELRVVLIEYCGDASKQKNRISW